MNGYGYHENWVFFFGENKNLKENNRLRMRWMDVMSWMNYEFYDPLRYYSTKITKERKKKETNLFCVVFVSLRYVLFCYERARGGGRRAFCIISYHATRTFIVEEGMVEHVSC